MDFRLLGPLEVIGPDGPVPVRGAKQRTLLAALLLRPGDTVSDDQLVDTLWGDDPPGNPVNALQAQVSQLRRTLGEGVVVRRGTGYALDTPADDVDSSRFERLAHRGRRLLEDGDPRSAAVALRDALGEWRGPALADFASDDFARPTAVRLEELRLGATTGRIDAELELGHHDDVVAELETLTTEHPLHERFWAQLMVALYRCGRQADALRAYGEARDRLVEELGVEPGPELRALETKVLDQHPDLAATAPGPSSDASVGAPRTNLRAQLTRFVGRTAEAEVLWQTVRDARLVTIVGPGGAGKTRLGSEVAARFVDAFADGAWFVDLAPVTDHAGIALAVATSLGLQDQRDPRDPRALADAIERIVDHLSARSLLLVLDNCEHLLDDLAPSVDAVLGRCASVHVLATSRAPLAVPGEVIVPLDPLPLRDAVDLFVDRTTAASAAPTPEQQPLVEEICTRLDGLPLAIELAAARTRALPLAMVAERLDDRFRLLSSGARSALPRQQTLRAVVDWSYDLLFDDERVLFDRLAVFAGGCTLGAAERVCSDDTVPAADVVDLLARLVDKSLLVRDDEADGTVRYRLLQTLRDYAGERLAAAGAPPFHERHAHYYRELAAEAADGLRTATSPVWRRRLEADLDNLRAALDWYRDQRRADDAIGLAVDIAWVWFLRSEWAEGLRWLRDARAADGPCPDGLFGLAQCWCAYFGAFVEVPEAGLPDAEAGLDRLRRAGTPRQLGDGLLLAASLFIRARALDGVERLLAEAATVLSASGETWGLAVHRLVTSLYALQVGDFDRASDVARDAVDRFRAIPDRWGTIEALVNAGIAAEFTGDVEHAAALHREALDTARELDMAAHQSWAMARLANVLALQGETRAAEHLQAEAARLPASTATVAFVLNGRGVTARRRGDADRARRYHEEALGIYDATRLRAGASTSHAWLAWCAWELDDADAARHHAARALELARDVGDPRAEAFAFEAMAAAAVAAGDGEGAARALGAAAARRRALGTPPIPGEQIDVERVEAAARALARADGFGAAFASGASD